MLVRSYPTVPAPPRPTRQGRAYPPDLVTTVRALIERDGLSRREAAERVGLRVDLVKSWGRRFGWRRAGPEGGGSRLPSPVRGEPGGGDASGGVGGGPEAPAASRAAPPPPGSAFGPARPDRRGTMRRPLSYPPEVVEAARLRVEGSRDGLERIGIEIGGVTRDTLRRWAKAFGWQRPAPPIRPGPDYYRSRRFGRRYGGDAVGAARDLVTGTALSTAAIAKRVGISRCTVWVWMERGGWERPVRVGRTRPPYGPEVVATARDLYCTTRLSTRMIAARAGVPRKRVYAWASANGWTRPPGPTPKRRRAAGQAASRKSRYAGLSVSSW